MRNGPGGAMFADDNALLVAALATVGDPVVMATPDGAIAWANRAAHARLELLATECAGLMAPADRQGFREFLRAPHAPAFLGRALTTSGVLLSVRVERVVGASSVIALVFHVSEAADVQAQPLVAIINSTEDAIIGKSLDGIITSWNPAAERIFGYRAEEMIGHSVSALIPPGREHEEATILDHLRRGLPLSQLDTVRRRKDGRDIDVSITLSPVRDHTGAVVGASKVARDISERRKVERALVEANRMKSEFLANMSHELRTPLNAIIGFTELMYRGKVGPVAPNHHEYLGDILTSSKHLLQLINDVLDLSKVESGKMEFRPEDIDLERVVSEVRNILRGLIAEKHLTVSVRVDPSVGAVWADAARMKQVLYNYLSNAIKFTAERGAIEVRVTREEPEHFRLEVQDTGVGIRAEDMHRLFTEFTQLDAGPAKQYQGTGLGLALTKSIVELHGGRVEARSTRGQGSTFCAVVPRRGPVGA